MRQILIVLLVLCAWVSSIIGENEASPRQYSPVENDPDRFPYIPFRDETNGLLHVENISHTDEAVKVPVSDNDVKLYLYTRNNTAFPVPINIDQLDELTSSGHYNHEKPNVFIIHGWKNHHGSNVNRILKAAILKRNDTNVFVVDWSAKAQNYFTASWAVKELGEYLGDFIGLMKARSSLAPADFILIGHGLGAHLAGCAGARLKGTIGYIVGLDPAGPLFSLGNTAFRVDPSDAEYVEIIHTCGGLLGFESSIGHADFFPNNGKSQPGCVFDVFGECAHARAYYYLAESILNGGFSSKICTSYKAFKNGKCDDNSVSFLGTLNPSKRALGDYYLDTDGDYTFTLE